MDQRRSAVGQWLKRMGILLAIGIAVLWIIPIPNGNKNFSTVLYDQGGRMMGARIAPDGQWRFPIPDHIPENVATCIQYFEDEYFYSHPGINPVSIYRAIRQNVRAGRIVSGGSTITMQIARILRGNRQRSIWNKLIEGLVALQLELRYSKSQLMHMYAGLAPFGGNVVGLEAASWRYYGRSPELLSWAEASTLAVLPNAPSLIYPGRSQVALLQKRNRLLQKLHEKGIIDQITLDLAEREPLPQKPFPLVNMAPHLLETSIRQGHQGKRIASTIDYRIQQRHLDIMRRYHSANHPNGIHNLAIITAEITSGQIVSYIGNSDCGNEHEGTSVDIIHAPRSSGSILKPLLYASAYDEGLIVPSSLLPDIPTKIAGYSPENFDRSYAGAVRSQDALTKSLNIPAVRLLQQYGVPQFQNLLKALKVSTINEGADHYGLSLILGGAEVTLFEMVNAYRQLAYSLHNYEKDEESSLTEKISYLQNSKVESLKTEDPIISVGAIWEMMNVLSNLERPRAEEGWKNFAGNRKIAWKTGTSFGHRDAWAIGIDGKYVVGVWVGNADGEGRPGLTGLNYAGPILFDAFNVLPEGQWFEEPVDDLDMQLICADSGYRIGQNCRDTIEMVTPYSAKDLAACDYHMIHTVNKEETYIVDRSCQPVMDMKQRSYFVLPPTQAYYFRKRNANYEDLPPIKPGCRLSTSDELAIIYPFQNADVSIPVDVNGVKQEVIFSAAHTDPKMKLHWHLDNQYHQTTSGFHEISIRPSIGDHMILVIDENGNQKRRHFSVVD